MHVIHTLHTCSHLLSIISTAGNGSCLSRKKDAQHFTNTLFNTLNITARLPALPLAGKQNMWHQLHPSHYVNVIPLQTLLFVMLNHRLRVWAVSPSLSLSYSFSQTSHKSLKRTHLLWWLIQSNHVLYWSSVLLKHWLSGLVFGRSCAGLTNKLKWPSALFFSRLHKLQWKYLHNDEPYWTRRKQTQCMYYSCLDMYFPEQL